MNDIESNDSEFSEEKIIQYLLNFKNGSLNMSEQKVAEFAVILAILDGNLEPLAEHIMSGSPVTGPIAWAIAASIKGLTLFRITTVGMKTGQRSFSRWLSDESKKYQVGIFMESRIAEYGKSGYESALADTKKKFGISRRLVEEYRKYFKDELKNSTTEGDRFSLEFLQQFCPTLSP